MELEFIKKGNSYEAIFEVPSDFNIHIELDKPSYLGIYQSSIQDGEYSFTTEYKLNDIQKIYDIDFSALVYPKYIKVVSGSEVVKAFVTCSNGEATQIGGSKYEFVDLGLPSGTMWATTNIGATKPEEYGLYFAWGETEGYEGITDDKKFDWNDYKLCGGSEKTLTKYNSDSSCGVVDNLSSLEQVDDAAYQSDNTCRMPTENEMQELIDNTSSVWETLNGVNGRRFTSNTNGNSIFIPAAGSFAGGNNGQVGSGGCLWSSSLGENSSLYSWALIFNSGNVSVNWGSRYFGVTIRPVQNK